MNSVFLSLPRNLSHKPAPKQAARTELKIVYDESKAALFRSELMNEALQRLNSCVDSSPVDSVVNSFTEYFFATTALVFGKETHVSEKGTLNPPRNKWFDQQCREVKNEFKRARNTFLRLKNATNRKSFQAARTKYNRSKYKAKQKFKIKEGKNICDIAKKQTRKFWKEIKRKFKPKSWQSETLTAEDLLSHFKTLFGDDSNTSVNFSQSSPAPPPPNPPQPGLSNTTHVERC